MIHHWPASLVRAGSVLAGYPLLANCSGDINMLSRSAVGFCVFCLVAVSEWLCASRANEPAAARSVPEAESTSFQGRQWQTRAPRSEMRPRFFVASEGDAGKDSLAIETSNTPG